jgi:apolipoprotein D and lipocalin family protein
MPEHTNAKRLPEPRRWLTLVFFLGVLILPVQTTADEDSRPLTTVSFVDLNRYLGKWYEIASYPAWFQRGCTGATADYSRLPDGRIRVVNRCFKKSLDGPLKESKGKAEVVDTATNAKLKVWFFWPFKGDYWIIDLDPDYQWAVVGVPSRKYLWILSRTSTLDDAIYDGILRRVIENGYDPTRLQLTPQPQ